jgi:hypothetical protein
VITDPEAPSPMAHAGEILHPGPPALLERYPAGVQITPYGIPDWIPFARLLVELPPPPRGLGWDEARVLGVQTANELGRRGGDPLWTPDEPRTLAGWTWARLALTRRIALVPIELHGSFRHIGGVSTSGNDRTKRGLSGTAGPAPGHEVRAVLAEEVVAGIEERLGGPLPTPYREYLAGSDGGRPAFPAVHPGAGFVLDQPLFGGRDLLELQAGLRDRLEPGLLAICFVQGGTLVLSLRHGSVYYLDDDDPDDQQGYTPAAITRNLLRRLDPDFATFWGRLTAVPAPLAQTAERHAREGWARVLSDPALGRDLPPDRRA